MDFDKLPIPIALVTAILSLIANFLQLVYQQRIKRGIDKPVELPSGTRRNSIIIIGLGGSGKTTFINTLLGTAIPIQKTKRYELYRGEKLIPDLDHEGRQKGQTKHYFYISDYVGQNLGTLISSFILQQKRLFSPISYGYINSLIVMVDLVGPDSVTTGQPDPARIDAHLDQWNATALDAVWGLLRKESLRYVCLFINKSDKMHNHSPESMRAYAMRFQSLAHLLEERVKPKETNIEFEVFIGSAQNGAGTVIAKIQSSSVDSNFVPQIKEE